MDSSGELSEFEQLPLDIHRIIFKELSFHAFSRLKYCSKGILSLCERSGYIPQHNFWIVFCRVAPFYVRIEHPENKFETLCHWDWVVNRRYCEADLEKFSARSCRMQVDLLKVGNSLDAVPFSEPRCKMFGDRRVRIRELEINGDITCTMENFNRFLEDHKIECLTVSFPSGCSDFQLDVLLSQPAVRKLSRLQLNAGKADSKRFLDLRATTMHLPFIQLETIKHLLKEWRDGEREIVKLEFTHIRKCSFDLEDVSEVKSQISPDLENVTSGRTPYWNEVWLRAQIRRTGETLCLIFVENDAGFRFEAKCREDTV